MSDEQARSEVMRLLDVLADPKKSKERLAEIDKRESAVEARHLRYCADDRTGTRPNAHRWRNRQSVELRWRAPFGA